LNRLIDAVLGHSRTVLTTLVLLLMAGTYAYVTIPKESSPDVNIPVIYTNVHHEGISPEDAERLLVQPLEQELRDVEGIEELRSIAYESGANVVMEFEPGFDADAALQDVRQKVERAKAELPREAEDPTVHEVNLSLFPVLVVTLSGDVPQRALMSLADDLQDDIESLPPVLEVDLQGDRDERVELIVDPAMMESYGIDAQQVQQAVSRSNQLVAAGSLDTGEGRFAVKVPGLFEDHKDILNMPVKVSGDRAVTFGDIGTLRRTFEDPESIARINGESAVALEVSKRTGENVIETIEQVRALVNRTSAEWPATVQVTYSQDNSTQIRTMLGDLQNNVLGAILLVMVIIVAVLGLRTAGLVGLAIPGSFLTGILVLALAGLTVNVVVLFSLILAVGMLVDGAIVVVEYADRKLREGEPPHRAYGLASKRMAWPIIAATATTLAAFFPLLFWPGMAGEFMKFLPITLLATLTASLLMALIFVPTLGSVLGRGAHLKVVDSSKARAIAQGSASDLTQLSGITGAYVRVLRAALRRPGRVIAGIVICLGLGVVAYGQWGRGVEFFPDTEPHNAVVKVHGRGNLTMAQRDRLVKEVESHILQLHRETGEFHAIYARSQISSGQRREEPEDIIGTIQLEFVDWWKRRPANEILADIKKRTSDLAGIHVASETEGMGPPTGKAIQLAVTANDRSKLDDAVERIVGQMRQDGDYINLEDSRPIPGIAWELKVDRSQAAKFGADVALVGSYVRMVTNGMKIGEYRSSESDDEIDIVVRFPPDQRSLSQLDQIRMETDQGSVPASNFVTRAAEQKTQLIKRLDGKRVMRVKADVAEGVLANTKVQELRDWLATNPLPKGIEVRFQGEDKEQREAANFLTKAFAVALFLMAIILVTQFNSFYSAFLILSAVVLSTLGVVLGLLVTGQPFGIVMSGIGVIALAGIVVNNNIVLIDTFDRLRQWEPDVLQAILRTGAQRLRPVLLTTVTTILGLMPMVLGLNIDFLNRLIEIGAPSTELWRQLATAIVAGLTFATVLTLILTPCALMLRANIGGWRQRRRGATPRDSPESGESGTEPLPRAAE
jgi:multidrug efflux pump